MGGKSSKSAQGKKKGKKSPGKDQNSEADGRREIQAWNTPAKLDNVEASPQKTLSPTPSALDLVNYSPKSETKVERVSSDEIAELFKNTPNFDLEEEDPVTTSEPTVNSVPSSPSEVVQRPKPPRAAFELSNDEAESITASERVREEKLRSLPELKVAPKKLHDISNIVGTQARRRSSTPENIPASKGRTQSLSSPTPSPPSYRNIGYVSDSSTPVNEDEYAQQQSVLQLTPHGTPMEKNNKLQADSPAGYHAGSYFPDLDRKLKDHPGMNVLELDQTSPAFWEGQEHRQSQKQQQAPLSPIIPRFESVLDDTDESLMQQILDS